MGIYMDNAATTMQKPDCVIDAVVNAMRHMGNSGRGAHEASLDASRLIYETREMLSELFNLGDPRQVAFTLNSTEALNTAILGLFDPGDHIISTVMEHNSVLRPLYRLEEKGCQVSFVPCDEKGRLRTDLLESFLKENTKALVCTHASNLTGNANDLMYLGRFCKDHGLLFVVDASQTEKERLRLEARNQEIDGMFLSLYTDKAKGILTEQRFVKLTAALEQEQESNQKRLHDLEMMQGRADAQESEVRTFIKEIRRYAAIEELDEAVLNRLISRILIGEIKKIDGQRTQEVKIIYNFVGEMSR